MVVHVDKDFSGTFDANEQYAFDYDEWLMGDEFQMYLGTIFDDGPWPGNGTASDTMNVRLDIGGYSSDLTINVNNVAPHIAYDPTVVVDADPSGDMTYTVSAGICDPGIRDAHRLKVTWSDGVVTTGGWESAGDLELSAQRVFPSGTTVPSNLHVTLLEAEDDDSGIGRFTMDELQLAINGNDDNGNGIDDNAPGETGFLDPGLISFSLASFKPIVPDPGAGKFVLNYDPQYLRMWDSQDKGTSILPYYDWTGTLTGNAYNGEDTIWLEGFDSGISDLSVAWVEDGYDDGMVFDGSSACTCMCQVIVHGGNAQITTWGVDIDVDSNNNGEIGDYDQNGIYEDDIERTSAKRIFVNIDDDNRNGIPDKNELSESAFVSDNDLAKTVLQIPVLDDYTGKKVRLTLDGDIRAWNALATSESSGVYEWVLDGVTMVSPGITVPTHSLFPLNIYIEGLEVGSASVKLELLDGGVVMGAPDDVTYSVEKIVWPNQDSDALAELDVEQNTDQWNGFKLNVKTENHGDEMGWYISKSLLELIQAGRSGGIGDFGYIRTEYPKEAASGRWEGAPEHNDSAVFDLGTLFDSGDWTPGQTVVVTLEYEFEQSPNIPTGQYVDATPSPRPGLFHNSGVKIENRAEVAIIDSQSIIDAIDNGHQAIVDGAAEIAVDAPGHDVDGTGTVQLQHGNPATPWVPDAPNKLINEIPYGAGPNTEAALRAAALPGHVVIEITRKANGKYLLKIDGVIWDDILQLSGPQTPEHQDLVRDMLIIQSHWGSGVIYRSASVREK